MPRFAITVGIPLSGKTVFCHEKMKEGWVIINPDTFRQVYSGTENTLLDSYGEDKVWGCVFLTVESLLRYGHNVILDATNVNKWSRGKWVELSNRMGIKLEIFVLPFDVELSIKRNREIGRFKDGYGTPTDKVIQKFAKNYSPPDETEGIVVEVKT
jgi:predicted kinase